MGFARIENAQHNYARTFQVSTFILLLSAFSLGFAIAWPASARWRMALLLQQNTGGLAGPVTFIEYRFEQLISVVISE